MEKFLYFINPYLLYIDEGKIFRQPMKYIYGMFAIISLLIPVLILISGIRNRVFSVGFGAVVAIILIWLIIVIACWFGFQIWWNRLAKLESLYNEKDDFVATPIFSHFLQTAGEWLGTFIAIVGAGVSLIGGIFGNSDQIVYSLGLPDFMASALWGIILLPLLGLLIIVTFRLLAEQLRALVSIANNTKS